MVVPKLKRSRNNPLLSPIDTRDHWWEARAVFNPAAAIVKNKIYILYRALGEVHYSTLGLAILSDPETVAKRSSHPVLEPESGNEYERFGVEDPRITFVNGEYQIVYNSPSIYPSAQKKPNEWDHMNVPWRLRCSRATTVDFENFKREGILLPKFDTKNGSLFPEKVNGKYVLLHRPYPDLCVSFSDSLQKFSRGKLICSPRKGKWDGERVGTGAPPLKTELGWLEFYHGSEALTDDGFRYSLGILLLDLNDPTRILYRSSEPILFPEEEYEKKGYVKNVVFTCGAIEWKNRYWIYYGGADKYVCTASIDKKELLNYLQSEIG